MRNKLIIIFSFVCLLLTLTNTSYAQNPRVKTASPSASVNSGALENLKNRAISEIDRRIISLNELLAKVTALKRISDTQKVALSSSIQSEINALTALKTKIQADTDITTLRTDTKSIVSSHRIFALFMPQIRLLAASDALDFAGDKMTELSLKLEAKISAASSSGQSVSDLQSLLSQMRANIANAQEQADSVAAAVAPLTADGYPENRSILMSAKQNLQDGHKSLKTAAQNARSIISKLLVMSVGNRTDKENSSSASSTMKPGVVNNLQAL